MIRVGNYVHPPAHASAARAPTQALDRATKKSAPIADGFDAYRVHIDTPLHPFVDKCKTEQGYFIDNYATFHGLFYNVLEQKRDGINYSKQWDHPAERHAYLNDKQELVIEPAYWTWRQKGFESKTIVPWPNANLICIFMARPMTVTWWTNRRSDDSFITAPTAKFWQV